MTVRAWPHAAALPCTAQNISPCPVQRGGLPGYGDAVDSTVWIDGIVDHIQSRFAEHYEASATTEAAGWPRDGKQAGVRVPLLHAAHRLKGVDLEF